jgi:hypothetical protein
MLKLIMRVLLAIVLITIVSAVIVPQKDNEAFDEQMVITLPYIDLTLDLYDREQVAIAGGIVASAIIILLIILAMFRLLFNRTPKFGNWQPPYANMPPHNPNSTYGRRQAWQQHSLNNIVPHLCRPGTVYPRKILLNTGERHLSNWQIMAARLTQYDLYGRISRSEALADNGSIKRLNHVASKSHKWEEKTVAKKVRPIAKSLVHDMKKNIGKRNLGLDISLDLRLRGLHGEVHIGFELYECRDGRLVQLDSWKPEMTVMGRTIHETYIFTLHGQKPGEKNKEFFKRLRQDIERVLTDMFCVPLTIIAEPEKQETLPETPLNVMPPIDTSSDGDDSGGDAISDETVESAPPDDI